MRRTVAASIPAILTVSWAACFQGAEPTVGGDQDVVAPGFGTNGGDSGDEGPGAPPLVTIVAPQASEVLPAGEPVTLTGIVEDDRDLPASLVVTWSSDRDGTLGTFPASATGLVVAEVDALSPGDHVLTLRAIDTEGGTGEAEVEVLANAPPAKPLVLISPESPGTDDDLEASLVEPASDPNRGAELLAVTWRWFKDGEDAGLSGPKVPAALTARGEKWQVRVLVSDGYVQGPQATAEVVVGNSAPACGHATLLPSAGTALDAFTCACTDRDDPDGDPPDGDACEFRLGGVPLASEGCTLPPGNVAKGDELACVFTPSDGLDAGGAVQSEPAAILNAPPPAPVVGIDPPFGGLGTTFTCEILETGVDPDGDPLDWNVSWVVGGFENPGPAPAAILAGDLAKAPTGTPAEKGDLLRCRVRSFDGEVLSAPGDSAPIVLGNSPPDGGAALVTPAVATEATVLSCEASGAVDPDGDEVSWLYGWHLGGVPIPGQASKTLGGAFFDKGDQVGCTATPTDGQLSGAAVSSKNTATVVNTLPAVAKVEATPASANQNGAFTCAWSGWIDPDPADLPDVALSWQVESAGVWVDLEGAEGPELAAAGHPKGTKLRCVALPWNANDAGPATASAAVAVSNTLPSIAKVSVTPAAGGPCTSWLCEAEGVLDPDPADQVLVAWRWTVDELPAGVPKAVLEGVPLVPGKVLRCHAQPTDGSLGPGGLPLYGLEVSSAPVVVGNAKPTVASAGLAPLVPSPEDVLTCTPSGLADPDECQGAPGALFKWYVDGFLVFGEEDPTLAAAGISEGSEVRCQVVPDDGFDTGEPVFSNAVVVGPQKPVVSIVAPQGAAGAVTCQLVKEGTWSEPLTYKYFWTVNGGPALEKPATLAAADVDDCDVLTCFALGSAPGYQVFSNTDDHVFAFGPDCGDGDACTTDGCKAAGGCSHVQFDGPCEDGNPCTAGESCQGGICTGPEPLDCDDDNPCTADKCTGAAGCVHTAVSGSCGAGGAGTCIDGACCVPACGGKGCGDDGCGGSCGSCDEPAVCDDDSGQCFEPTPGMAIVPKGGFWMGCNAKDDAACKNDELPFHLVQLPAYEIDLEETTVAEYAACVASFECTPPGTAPGCHFGDDAKAGHPINCVDWYDADFFCAWDGKRLCTEAEWEKAARGSDGRRYPWGFPDPDCTLASFAEGGKPGCGAGAPPAVGSFPDGASPFGVLDMAGSVFEWVSDWYDDTYYAESPAFDPQGPAAGSFKVRRGGGFDSAPEALRCSARRVSTPGYTEPAFGIRCCKDFP